MFEFIHAEKADFPIKFMCERLGVTRRGYYAWRKRPPCQRRIVDAAYTAVIKRIHTESRSTYGAPRIHAELADDYNIRCGRKRVARLMRNAGLVGCHRRKKAWTTKRDSSAAPAPDRVKRDFTAKAPESVVGRRHHLHSNGRRASGIWPPCSMPSADESWAGPTTNINADTNNSKPPNPHKPRPVFRGHANGTDLKGSAQ